MAKRVAPEILDKLAEVTREIVEKETGPGERRVAQKVVGKRIGVSQGRISQLLKGQHADRGGVEGPSLQTLLALRAYTKRSLDDLLGLPPLTEEAADGVGMRADMDRIYAWLASAPRRE